MVSFWNRKFLGKSKIFHSKFSIIAATDDEDVSQMKDEFGDLFLDLLASGVIAENAGLFKIEDCVQGAIKKLRRRKPQVFSEEHISREEEKKHYVETKKEEKSASNQ